jgi:hypothetical protein
MNQLIEPLTAADRCDRCGARAVIAFKPKGQAESNLLFCSHHTISFKETLKTSAQIIWDERGQVVHEKLPITL